MNYLNNYCAITEVRPSHFHQTRVAATTFIKNNPWFDGILVILTTNLDQITVEERAQLDQIYDKIDIVEVDRSKLKELATKIKTSKREFNSIFDYFFTYAFGIKSKGNLYFKSSVIFNKPAVPFLEKDKTTFAIGEGRIPMGSGTSINPAMFYIPGEFTSDSLQESVIKHLRLSNNIYYKSAPSSAIQAALEDHRIPINRLPMINLVDSSNFPNTRYREFLRYNKGIVAINMNTAWVNDNRFAKINLYWQHANKLSLKYRPSATKISKKAALDLEIKKQKRYKANQKLASNDGLDKLDVELMSVADINKTNTAMCTICNDQFIKGAQVMIHSFLNCNKWFKGDIIVMHSDNLSTLSEDSKSKLKRIYNKIVFRNIDEGSYNKAIDRFVKHEGVHQNFMPSLFTFEVFAIEGYDQVLYIDSDILHINNMLDMVRTKGDFIVTPAALSYPASKHYDFSGGVFMVRGKMSSVKIKEELLKFSLTTKRFNLLDQTIMNDFFKRYPKSWVSNDYNCSKRCFDDRNFHKFNSKISLVHYVSEKPWNEKTKPQERKYSKLESLWIRYYEKFFERNEKVNNKKVIVIGNSPNVINYEVGDQIDDFDVVIRVNDFRTIGFEKNVGRKTDKVVTTFATNFKTKEYDSISANQVLMSLFDKKGQTKYLNDRIEKYGLYKVNVLPDYYYLGLNEEVGISGANKRCSSGTIALKWAIDNYPGYDIYIHGIDLIKSNAHYFDQPKDKVNAWRKSIDIYHDFDKEKEYINGLLKSNIIKKLI